MSRCIKKWISFVFIVTCILYCTVYSSANSTNPTDLSESELRTYTNENNTWLICCQQGSRSSKYTSCDATDKYYYFSYNAHDCVDVYDTNGLFLYSILLPQNQNGAIGIRCVDDQVFIRTKNKVLYIFEGTEEITRMDYDMACEMGYDYRWFFTYEPQIKVDTQWISRLDSNGNVIEQITTPAIVRQTIPLSLSGWQILIKPSIIVLIILAFAYLIAFRNKKI